MPPKRSTRASAHTTSNQSTLTFSSRSKPTQSASSRITKSASTAGLNKDQKSSLAAKTAAAETQLGTSAAPEIAELVLETAEDEQQQQLEEEEDFLEQDPDALALREQESAARKLTDKRIRSYWADKEAARKAPRVHQRSLSLEEKVLREFDMSGEYGPSIGVKRSDRWRRAFHLGLKPPIEVLAVLVKSEDKEQQKSNRKGPATATTAATAAKKKGEWLPERSIVEDLMASRVGTGLEA